MCIVMKKTQPQQKVGHLIMKCIIFKKTLHDILANKRRAQLSRRLTMLSKCVKAHKRNNMSIETCLFKLFNTHYCSYDNNTRHTKSYDLPPLSQHNMLSEFTSHDFYYVSVFGLINLTKSLKM